MPARWPASATLACTVVLIASIAHAQDPPEDLVQGRSPRQLSSELARLRGTVHRKPAPRPSAPPPVWVEPDGIWGEVAAALNARSTEGDLRELESTFTLPQAGSLTALDVFANYGRASVGSLVLRNVTDDDWILGLSLRTPEGPSLRTRVFQSRFVDMPVGDRNTRSHAAAFVDFRSPGSLPAWFEIERTGLVGRTEAGLRDWIRESYALGLSMDVPLVGGALLELPISRFADQVSSINNVKSTGARLRLFTNLPFFNGSLGYQIHRISTGATKEDENLVIWDLSTISRRVYRINGLESRTRAKIVLRNNAVTQTTRVKRYYEGFSTLTYKRYRQVIVEMGGSTRYVKRRRLDARGLAFLGTRNDIPQMQLFIFDQEDKIDVREGWTSVSYRGIPYLHVNARSTGMSVSDPPLTDVGGLSQPSLLVDSSTGYSVDLALNPLSAVWGANLKVANRKERNTRRSVSRDVKDVVLALRGCPFPWLAVHGDVSRTTNGTDSAEIRAGQTDVTWGMVGLTCEASPCAQVFADLTEVRAAGALPSRQTTVELGLEARRRKDDRAVTRLTLARDHLSGTAGSVVPYDTYLASLEHRRRF